MLWTVFIILIALWLLGLIGGIGGQLIHLLLIIAGAMLIYNVIRNRLQAF